MYEWSFFIYFASYIFLNVGVPLKIMLFGGQLKNCEMPQEKHSLLHT